ncbi:hypothetical protein ABW20_dc0103827 [Dactylellina cionopaga]|nr:hypothetical protein ABW20_dc0103827 [Dactylellina cionopaga]
MSYNDFITMPEKSWPVREGTNPPQYENSPESEQHDDKNAYFYGLTSLEAQQKHAKKVVKGLPPNPFRFHPIKAAIITLKSVSRLSSYSNLLFPAIPIGIVMWYARRETYPLAVFILNFIAIIPSGNLLAFASRELHHKLPRDIAATLEILTGAIVEIIITLVLLFGGHFGVVRDALMGSMLANLLLMTGACFLSGGIRHSEQRIAEYVTKLSNAALLVSAAGMMVPSLFFITIQSRADITEHRADKRLLHVSRVVSIGLLISYICFILFQLMTHNKAYHRAIEEAEETASNNRRLYRKKLSMLEAIFLTLIGLTLVTFCAYFLVQEIPYIVKEQGVSEEFMGLILVPFIEKSSEHLIAINQAWHNQMTLALSQCLGATVQTALLVTPIVVLVGWSADLDMDLRFEFFLIFLLLVSVLVVGNFIKDGRTNWLEGVFLLMVYFAVAVAAYNYPNLDERHREGPPGREPGEQKGTGSILASVMRDPRLEGRSIGF